jgi:hypothetical protein
MATLEWRQPEALSRRYELRSGQRLIGTLKFQNAFSQNASGEIMNQIWHFTRRGVFPPKVMCMRKPKGAAEAVYTPFWSGRAGELQIPGGKLRWESSNVLGNLHSFLDAQRHPVLRVQKHGLFKSRGELSVPGEGQAPRADLPLLMLLAWYLVIVTETDQATTAAVLAAS